MARRARDIMSTDLVTVRSSATVREAAKAMLERRVGSVLVVDEKGALLGIVSEGDFVGKKGGYRFTSVASAYIFGDYVDFTGLKETYDRTASAPVYKVMATDVATVTPDAHLEDVVGLMLQRDVKRVPVVDAGRLVGIVARHDLLKVMLTQGDWLS